ncbi:hypothetical protein R6242_08885 [Iodobacter sp. CM08]|uniref:GH39 family glycosyl hydrolase n=1 Tax=Iodobacter sp. CM08 TaxID=3085902 RepID=UPI002980E3BF|nr:hypothetical protein [Iodobacter sp. CM08]MDW5416684.1 hypothetical protein [Iodobacter sp. CM08]
MTKLLQIMQATRLFVLLLLSIFCLQSAVAVDEPLMLKKSNTASLLAVPLAKVPARLGKGISSEYFGMHVHRPDLNKSWPLANISSWRLWDLYTGWKDIEPKNGQFDFVKLDAIVEFSKKNNISLLLPLGLTPEWASSRPKEKCAYGFGCAAEPSDMKYWRRYVKTVASRYDGVVFDYELLNEVNLTPFWSGSLDVLLEMQKIAYAELKAVNPKNRLVGPSMTGNSESELSKWDKYLAMGAGKYLDIVSYHLYVPKSEPEVAYGLVERLYQIMAKNHVENKPLWNTESGWLIENLSGPSITNSYSAEWLRLDQSNAVASVMRSNILALTQGVDRFYWYSYDHLEMGLSEPSSKHKKAAAFAYQNLASQLIGSKAQGCRIDRSVIWMCKFIDRLNSVQYFVWTTDEGVHKISRLKIGSVTSKTTFPMGESEKIVDDDIYISRVPVLLK